jgi:hypothetical protein
MSAASTELAALRAHGASLDERLSAVDTQQRAAVAARDAASEALTRLEQKAVSGDNVTASARQKAEDALVRAQAEAAAPWAERRAAVAAAIRAHAQEERRFVIEHLDELYSDLAPAAEAAAADVDHACRSVLEAVGRRMAVEQDVTRLIGLVRTPDPNAVARTRTEAVSQAINTLLLEGGERAPLLRDDPRQPVQPTAEAEPGRESEPAPA